MSKVIRIGNFIMEKVPKHRSRTGFPYFSIRTASLSWSTEIRQGMSMFALFDEFLSYVEDNKMNPPLESFMHAVLSNMYAVCNVAPDAALVKDITGTFDAWADRNRKEADGLQDKSALEDVRRLHGDGQGE